MAVRFCRRDGAQEGHTWTVKVYFARRFTGLFQPIRKRLSLAVSRSRADYAGKRVDAARVQSSESMMDDENFPGA